MPLYKRILIGMLTGFFTGLAVNFFASDGSWLELGFKRAVAPIGQVFLSLLFMMVLPLICSALIIATHKLCVRSDMPKVASSTMQKAFILAFCAGVIALISSYLIPQSTLSSAQKDKLAQLACTSGSWVPTKLSASTLIPKNPFNALSQAFEGGSMLPVMIFATLFGFSLAKSQSDKSAKLIEILEVVQQACFAWIDWLMQKTSPFAVFCLVASSVQTLGLDLLWILGGYVSIVILALAFQQFVVYGFILKFFARVPVVGFFRGITTVMLTAFSTSSSSATLPISLETAQKKLNLDPDTSRMILTFGASANQTGSALYEGVTVLFLCQLFGVKLLALDQLMVLCMCIVASFGTAGIPGGTLPLMASILESLGVPSCSLLLILGIDRLLDMTRTTVNVTGDLVLAQWMESSYSKRAPVSSSQICE